jgi:hypothetical protein
MQEEMIMTTTTEMETRIRQKTIHRLQYLTVTITKSNKGFDCIAIAANDVEIETPEEEPGLFVCKVVEDPNQEVVPSDFGFLLIGEGFQATPPDCTQALFVGEYSITENTVALGAPPPDRVRVEGDCTQDTTNPQRATGVVEEGETEVCTFINTYEDDS